MQAKNPGGPCCGSMQFTSVCHHSPYASHTSQTSSTCMYFCKRCEGVLQIMRPSCLCAKAHICVRCSQFTSKRATQTIWFPFVNSYLITELPAPAPAAAPTDAAASPAATAATPSPTDPEPAAIPASHDPRQPAADLCPFPRFCLFLHLWAAAAVAAPQTKPVAGPQPSFTSNPAHAFACESINKYVLCVGML